MAIAEAVREGRLPGAEIAVVLSNLPDAAGLEAARKLGLPAIAIPSAGRKRAEHDAEVDRRAAASIASTWSASPDTCASSRRSLCAPSPTAS